MRKLSAYCICTFLAMLSFAPKSVAQLSDSLKKVELEKLLDKGVDASGKAKRIQFITNHVLDSMFIAYRRALSGSVVEEGKLIGSSASITDKSATVNIGIGTLNKNVFPMLSISGTGENSTINLLEKGKYANTLSIGGKVNIFSRGSGFFNKRNAHLLHNQLLHLKATRGVTETGEDKLTKAYDAKLEYIYEQIEALHEGHDAFMQGRDSTALDDYERELLSEFLVAADTLQKLELLPKDFLNADEKNDVERAKLIAALYQSWESARRGAGPDQMRLHYYIAEADALQMNAKWNMISMRWFTIAINYNATPYKILDRTAIADDYVRKSVDNFASGFVSWNCLRARPGGQQLRFFFSPTLNWSFARVYKDADKLTLGRDVHFPMGADSIVNRNLSVEVYPDVAASRFSMVFEPTLLWFWNKKNFGVSIVPKLGYNDAKEDNAGLRIGLYIPAGNKDGTPVLIEPLFRLQKLFGAAEEDFWRDNVVFGFNLSVSLPTGIGKIALQR